MCDLDRSGWSWSLRENGPQRYRVRGYAIDRRKL